MNAKGKVSDIAKLAGVSVATVSRTYRSPQMVRESARMQVIEAAQSLGYSPKSGCKSLAIAETSYRRHRHPRARLRHLCSDGKLISEKADGAGVHGVRTDGRNSDVLAFGVLIEYRKLGIRIPDGITVTGFDDLEFAVALDPPLTTVAVPAHEMEQRTAEVLLDAMTTGGEIASVRLETSHG